MASARAPRFRDRLRYRLDNTLARGTAAVVVLLALFTFALMVVFSVVYAITRVADDEGNFFDSMWLAFTRALDPGTMADDTTWPFRLLSLLVTLIGIFIVSTLIGLISNGVDQRVELLRKGRSPVLEEGHTLILGWSPKLFAVVSELIVANENQKDPCVVIMAPRDKVEMEDELRSRVGHRRNTRIVCRTGDPSDPADLEIVNPRGARSVIALCPDDAAGDAQVVRTVLALQRTVDEGGPANVVAEFTSTENADALRDATGDRISTVVSTEVIGRITAQVCRQSGLSGAYQELLDFDGDEIYFGHEPQLVGRTFADAVLAYDDSAVLGLRHGDGRIELNPPAATVIGERDMIVAVTADDDTLVIAPLDRRVELPPPAAPPAEEACERILVVGWNQLGPLVLAELDRYVERGSSAHVLYDADLVDPDHLHVEELRALEVRFVETETARRETIADALAAAPTDHVIILCYRRGLTPAESDARTLMTLLQLRQHLATRPPDEPRPSIATELLDVRDVELAKVSAADDFVVSDRLTSLMMAQLAENRELDAVFDELFGAEGTDLSLRPAERYASIGTATAFGEVVRTGLASGEVVIGYRSMTLAAAGGPLNGIVLNPPKRVPVTLEREDQLVVLTAPG